MPLLADPPTWNEVHAVGLPPLEVGRSYLGNSINLYHAMRANILVLGGVHGDESEGIFLAQLLLRHQSVRAACYQSGQAPGIRRQAWTDHTAASGGLERDGGRGYRGSGPTLWQIKRCRMI